MVSLTILWPAHRSTRARQFTTTGRVWLLSEQKVLAVHGEGAMRRWWYSGQGSTSAVGHANAGDECSDLKVETGCEGCVTVAAAVTRGCLRNRCFTARWVSTVQPSYDDSV